MNIKLTIYGPNKEIKDVITAGNESKVIIYLINKYIYKNKSYNIRWARDYKTGGGILSVYFDNGYYYKFEIFDNV